MASESRTVASLDLDELGKLVYQHHPLYKFCRFDDVKPGEVVLSDGGDEDGYVLVRMAWEDAASDHRRRCVSAAEAVVKRVLDAVGWKGVSLDVARAFEGADSTGLSYSGLE